MRKTTKSALFIGVCIVSTISCNNKSKRSSMESAQIEDSWTWPDSIENVFVLPDSIQERMVSDSTYTIMDYLPAEKRELFMSVLKVVYKYTTIENNREVFTMTREDFLKTGIPEVYYDWILSTTKDNNDFLDKNRENWENLEEMEENWKEEMRKEFPGIDK